METLKYTLGILAVIIFFLELTWLITRNEFFLYKFFAPKMEQVRRETFEESKAYKTGMIQELQNMQFEYLKTDSLHREGLAQIILRRAADFDEDKLPNDLKNFIQDLRNKQNKQYKGY